MKTIIASFTEKGLPKTGLTPVIDIWRVSDNAQVVTAATMTEIAGGHYEYNFNNDPQQEYTITIDGDTTATILKKGERFQFGVISLDEVNLPGGVA